MADTTIGNSTENTSIALTDQFATQKGSSDFYTGVQKLMEFINAGTHFIRQAAARTLTSSVAEQKLFDSVTNGRITLETGTYLFDCQFVITSMSATTGNAAFDILGAGTATLADVLYHAVGGDSATGAAGAAQGGSTMVAAQTAASLVTGATATALGAHLKGTFECTGAGTIVPSITLVTAAAGVVAAGSFFRCERIGAINMVSKGSVD